MTTARSFIFILVLTALFTATGLAQKTTPKRTTTAKSTQPKVTKVPPLDVRAERVKVDNQLSNVNNFIKVLAPVAQGIESIDNDIRTGKVDKKIVDKNQANKQQVITAIGGLKDALSALENDFLTKPDLKIYLPKLQGISDLAAQSQSLATSGKFVGAGDPLKTIAQKLSDTLAAIPNVEL